MIAPLSVVPHPRNRGGDTTKSLRTMQLNGTLAADGYDTVEANSNAVCVEERPAGAGGSGTGSGRSGSYFQDDFAQKLKTDPTCWSEAMA